MISGPATNACNTYCCRCRPYRLYELISYVISRAIYIHVEFFYKDVTDIRTQHQAYRHLLAARSTDRQNTNWGIHLPLPIPLYSFFNMHMDFLSGHSMEVYTVTSQNTNWGIHLPHSHPTPHTIVFFVQYVHGFLSWHFIEVYTYIRTVAN